MIPRVEEKVISLGVPQKKKKTTEDVENDNVLKRVVNKLKWLTEDMMVAYAFSITNDDILNTSSEDMRSKEIG